MSSNSAKIVAFSRPPVPRSPALSDYEKDDRESELQIASLKRAFAHLARELEEEWRAALAIAADAGSGP